MAGNNDRYLFVDPETYEVRVDSEIATGTPAERLPLTQLYYIV